MTSQLDSEHGDLLSAAGTLTSAMATCGDRIVSSGSFWAQHGEFAARVALLGDLLNSAVELTQLNRYQAALITLRTALEHHIFDQLMFLADRYEEIHRSVSADVFRRWEQERDNLPPETSDIVEMKRENGNVRVVRRGRMVDPGDGREPFTISIYYGFHEQHDPFVGRSSAQAGLAGEFTQPEVHERWARQSQELWATGLRWDSLRRNLLLNDLASESELFQLDVHYGFLSAFVHPSSREATNLLYHGSSRRSGQYDHFVSELILLYVVALASRELRAFADMAERPPQFGLSEWAEVEREHDRADELSAHFWFPGGVPHDFDRIQEANDRGLVDGAFVPREQRQPRSIPEGEIRYYRNPLRRLIRMHSHQNEMTGFPYTSPWHREDAFMRA